MELTKETKIGDLYKLQKVLDAKIIAAKSLEGQDLLGNLVLGLQVKIGEMADAWRGYKHWSSKPVPEITDKVDCPDCSGRGFWFSGERVWCGRCKHTGKITSPILAKYAECLSFFLAIANQLNLEEDALYSWQEELEGDTTRVFIEMQYHAGLILLKEKMEDKLFNFRVANYIFANMLEQRFGFEWEQIVAAYLERNEINTSKLCEVGETA